MQNGSAPGAPAPAWMCSTGKIFAHPALLLMLLVFLLHGSALSGWWRWDDAEHLLFVSTFQPGDYLINPEVWQRISRVNFTPLLSLSYSIDLGLFGMQPKAFYAHHLLVLGGAAIMLYLLLALWLPKRWAWCGAALFLSGAPVYATAQQIMSRHYVEGLLWSCAALYLFVLAIRKERAMYAYAGAGFYLLAMLCKEIYAPLIGLLPFMLDGTLRARLKQSIPYMLAAAIYVGWRLYMLSGAVGGYSPLQEYDAHKIFMELAGIPRLMLGNGGVIKIAGLAALLSAAVMMIKMRALRQGLLMVILLLLLLLPLVPVAFNPGFFDASSRYLLLLWVYVCLIAAWLLAALARLGWQWRVVVWGLVGVIAFSALQHGFGLVRSNLKSDIAKYEALGRFVWEADADSQAFFDLPKSANMFYVYFLSRLRQLSDGVPPRVASDEIQLADWDLKTKSVWDFDASCQCMADISRNMRLIMQDWRLSLDAHPLQITAYRSGSGFSWDFGPYTDQQGRYHIISDVIGRHLAPAKKEGFRFVFDIDPGIMWVRFDSNEGWVTYSAPFYITESGIEQHMERVVFSPWPSLE